MSEFLKVAGFDAIIIGLIILLSVATPGKGSYYVMNTGVLVLAAGMILILMGGFQLKRYK